MRDDEDRKGETDLTAIQRQGRCDDCGANRIWVALISGLGMQGDGIGHIWGKAGFKKR